MIYIYSFPPDIAEDMADYLASLHHTITVCHDQVEPENSDLLIMDSDEGDHGPLLQHTSNLITIGLNSIAIPSARFHRHIPKPLTIAQLHLLIQEWQQSANQNHIQLSNEWRFDAQSKSLSSTTSQHTIELTDKEAQLLNILLAQSPNAIEKDALLKTVWGYDETVDTHTLETHIYRLRNKLGELMPKGKGLLTSGEGYRFEL